MRDDSSNDTSGFESETGASTGDARENDPESAGFTPDDKLFRSHFQHVNRLADRSYEDLRPEYRLGHSSAPAEDGRTFDAIETDLENGWLNVRTAHGDWASAPETAPTELDRERSLGRVRDMPPVGTTPSHDRQSFSDPVPNNTDPTAPDSPEQTFDYQRPKLRRAD